MAEGRFGEARDALARFAELSGRNPDRSALLVNAVERYRRTGVAEPLPPDLLDLAGPAGFARTHFLMLLGHHEDALRLLEEGYRLGDPGVVMSVVSAVFDPLRTDLRFVSLLKQAGLPQ